MEASVSLPPLDLSSFLDPKGEVRIGSDSLELTLDEIKCLDIAGEPLSSFRVFRDLQTISFDNCKSLAPGFSELDVGTLFRNIAGSLRHLKLIHCKCKMFFYDVLCHLP